MSQEPWKSDQWFSSPWNYLPEVMADLAFADEVQIHDVTLRDGERQAGVEFTADDKVRIAEALAESGIHRIEAGLPAVSPADKEAIERMVAADLPTEVYAFSRCLVSDVELALDCGVKGVVMEVPPATISSRGRTSGPSIARQRRVHGHRPGSDPGQGLREEQPGRNRAQ